MAAVLLPGCGGVYVPGWLLALVFAPWLAGLGVVALVLGLLAICVLAVAARALWPLWLVLSAWALFGSTVAGWVVLALVAALWLWPSPATVPAQAQS